MKFEMPKIETLIFEIEKDIAGVAEEETFGPAKRDSSIF